MSDRKAVTVVFTGAAFAALIAHLHETLDCESMVIGFFQLSDSPHRQKLLVREVKVPKDTDYLERSPALVSLQPDFLEECFQYCEENECHLLDIHTHPWSASPNFSSIDDREALQIKIPYLREYLPDVSISFLLFGSNSGQVRGRLWDERGQRFHEIDNLLVHEEPRNETHQLPH